MCECSIYNIIRISVVVCLSVTTKVPQLPTSSAPAGNEIQWIATQPTSDSTK